MESPFSFSRVQNRTSDAGDSEGDGTPRSIRGGDERQLTVRALAAGLGIGSLLAFSNTYFGLQTGWVTMGSLQSAILGFGAFRLLEQRSLVKGFTMEENVIVQTTAVATATMPLAAGLVGVIPALTLMSPDQNPPDGPIILSSANLILWSIGLAYIGVFCAVPLRTQTVLREKLRFPSGTATAHVIRTLHGVPAPRSRAHAVRLGLPAAAASQGLGSATSHHQPDGRACHFPLNCVDEEPAEQDGQLGTDGAAEAQDTDNDRDLEEQPLMSYRSGLQLGSSRNLAKSDSMLRYGSLESKKRSLDVLEGQEAKAEAGDVTDWQSAWQVLMWTTLAAGGYTVLSSLKPFHWLRSFPVLTWVGLPAATAWGWELAPSMGYIGQGMIMGPRTAVSMLAGAIAGWGVLGPIARRRGWAPGHVMDWKNGAAGWVLWVSLAIMLGDSLSSLALLSGSTSYHAIRQWWRHKQERTPATEDPHPPNEQIPTHWWMAGLVASAALATAVLSPMLHLPPYEPMVAVAMALLVAVLAVRALGQTDLNPVSGVGKLSQVVFALVAPGRVVPNLVAGAVAEAGAQQAGDMMQDFKTAHLLGVSPRAQFFAMLLGSTASVFVSVGAYKLYTTAWEVPGPELPAPTAAIWLDMASLVNGGKLPEHVVPFCIGGGIVGCLIPVISEVLKYCISRLQKSSQQDRASDASQDGSCSAPARSPSRLKRVSAATDAVGGSIPSGQQWLLACLRLLIWLLPSGIGFAVGMYVSPKWTIPRVVGSILEQVWLRVNARTHSNLMVIVASGLVLGEGVASILNAAVRAAL